MTFSVEIQNHDDPAQAGEIVHIFINKENIDQLILDLKHLKQSETGKSIRLFSESWGTGDLTEELQRQDTSTVHLLRIWRA